LSRARGAAGTIIWNPMQMPSAANDTIRVSAPADLALLVRKL
jgi:hypothetical protein